MGVTCIAATDNCFDPGLYLQNIKWFGDIIIRTVFETKDLIHIIALCGQHDDWNIRKFPYLLADFKTGENRKHHIQ